MNDLQWLISPDAEPWLRLAERGRTTPSLVKSLRKDLSPEQTTLVLELAELRARAGAKFAAAAKIFFTRKAYEQATDEATARFKAGMFTRQFGANCSVADLCCGIGGDSFALAEACANVLAVDNEPGAALLAQANFAALDLGNARAVCDDATAVSVEQFSAWHIDPDRRPTGERSSQLEFSAPSAEEIRSLLAKNSNACIKLAPAAEPGDEWRQGGRQWIGDRRTCRQQLLWLGDLAVKENTRSAVVLHDHGAEVYSAAVDESASIAEAVRNYVYEPYPSVLAAGLHDSLAVENGAFRVTSRAAYFTSDDLLPSPFWAAFEVLRVLPLRVKTIKRELQALRIGALEVKKRGVDLSPEQLSRELSSKLPGRAVLLATCIGEKAVAILANRISAPS